VHANFILKLSLFFAHNLIVFGTILLKMYSDEEVANDNKLAAYPLPLPAIDDTEDTPPFTKATDGLNLEPSKAQANYYDTNNWGDYKEDEQEPNKPGDDIYYSDNEEESPFKSTYEGTGTKRLQTKRLQTKHLQTKRLRDKRSTGQNVYRDKRSTGQNVYGTKRLQGQNVYGTKHLQDKTFHGTKFCPLKYFVTLDV